MADNQTPKRPHYFKSQFLVLRDFDDEQTFHMEMLRRHNRGLHGWGVVRGGLQVTAAPDKTSLLITPGSAVDNLGREIALDSAAVLFFQNNDQQLKWNATASAYELPSKDVAAAAGVTGNPLDVYVTISFQESKSDDPDDQYPPPGGTVDVTRLRQTPLLKVEKAPPDDGSSIKLARVNVDVGGTLGTPDMSVRPQMGCIGPLYLTSTDGRPQLGIDYDPQSDALRVRARTKDAPTLDATHLTIKRDTGNVGIGTMPTAARLSIFSNSGTDYKGVLTEYTVEGPYKLSLRYSSPGRDMLSYHFDLTNNLGATFPDSLVVDRGNVGIGAESPGSNINTGNFFKADAAGRILDLYSQDHESVLILSSKQDKDGAHLGGVYFTRTGGQADAHHEVAGIQGRQTSTGALAGGSLHFFTKPNGTGVGVDDARMVILANGNVGVGTSGPIAKLQVNGGADTSLVIGDRGGEANSGSVGLQFLGTHYKHAGLRFDGDNVIVENAGNSYVPSTWYSSTNPMNFIVRNGKVGIGANPPESNLHLNVPGSSNPISAMSVDVQSFGTSANAQASHFFRVRDIGGNATPFYIRGDGKVGIGTANPLGLLSIGDGSVDGSDGHIVIGKKAGGGTRQYRIGFDKDFNFVIGDYGNSNVAGTWTSPFAISYPAPSNSLYINGSGNVGIGTKNPTRAKMEVAGHVSTTVAGYGYLNRDGASHTDTTYSPNYSIWASDRIAAIEFNATSDERIKNIRGRSDGAADLRTLLGIEITDYVYKDVITKGSVPRKKVTGQQVESVFPQAVSKTTDVVPDIYQQASVADGWVALATDLQIGERVRLISDEAEGVYEVLEATPDKFRTDFKPEGERVFVYGREVKDFRTVDYDAIAMLNVSATQQLKKEKDEEVKFLRAENAGLKSRLDALDAAMQRLLLAGWTNTARPDSTSAGATDI